MRDPHGHAAVFRRYTYLIYHLFDWSTKWPGDVPPPVVVNIGLMWFWGHQNRAISQSAGSGYSQGTQTFAAAMAGRDDETQGETLKGGDWPAQRGAAPVDSGRLFDDIRP
jgi:hypothetical protein